MKSAASPSVVLCLYLFTPILASGQAHPTGRAEESCKEAVPDPRAQAVPEIATTACPSSAVELKVPSGTPLRLAIDERVRIKKAGRTVHAKLVETLYAFDQPVLPAGTVVTGRVERIDPVAKSRRVRAYLD